MLGHRARPYSHPLFFVKETVFSRFQCSLLVTLNGGLYAENFASPLPYLTLSFYASLHDFCLTAPAILTFEETRVFCSLT